MNRAFPSLAFALTLCLTACVSNDPVGKAPSPSPAGKAVAQPTPQPSPKPRRIAVLQKEADYAAGGRMTRYTVQKWSPDLKTLLSRKTFDPDESRPLVSTTYLWEKDRLVNEKTVDSTGLTSGRTIYTYNAKGQVVEEKRYDDFDAPVFISRFEYDAEGRRTAWRVFSIKNKLIGSTVYDYFKGFLVRERMSDGDGRPGLSISYIRSESGELLAREYYDAEGALQKKESLAAGPGGVVTEKTISDGNALLFTTNYEYDRETGALNRKIVKNVNGIVNGWTIYYYAYREEEPR